MRIAITGGTGFVGRHLASGLVSSGHEVVLIARGLDHRGGGVKGLPNTRFFASDLSNVADLARAFSACGAVAHCAGINREIGNQTYQRVHVDGTRHVVEAARLAGVGKIALLSFLRARPDCGSGYHESKWAAEEIFRKSGLDYTILKAGVIYGQGDHMLDHLSHALFTFPVFAMVGFDDRPICPLAVNDLTQILKATLAGDRLSRQTIAVLGPEEMPLSEAVRRVAKVIGKRPLYIPMPVWFHYALAILLEATMTIPLVSRAQVRILSEGIVEPLPACASLPDDLMPSIRFTDDQIRRGLPQPAAFNRKDLRCCS
jgi:NADH dehydrogenase